MTTRRAFLKTASAAPFALGATGAFAAVHPQLKVPAKWDEETDVVVAGSGIAAMSAAIEAIDGGLKVIVFEKGKNYGGCAFINGGILNLGGGTRLQKAAGIHETPEDVYRKETDPKDPYARKQDRALVKKYSAILPQCQEWMEARGVKFMEELQKYGDIQHPHVYHHVWTPNKTENVPMYKARGGGWRCGRGIMEPFKAYFEGKGGVVRLEHKVVDVYKDDSGRVVGARIETPKGVINVKANKGVVLAGGSWKANPKLRVITDPRLVNIHPTGSPFVEPDGSAIVAGLRAGGMFIGDRGEDRDHLRIKIGTGHYRWGPAGLTIRNKKWAWIIHTNKFGERYVCENDVTDLGGYWFYDMALDQPEQKLWVIFDDVAAQKNRWRVDEESCEKGYFFKADTLEDLARITDQPKLAETVKRYNGFVDAKKDDDFDKPADLLAHKIETGPFYALRLVICVHNLTGGLRIDDNARVLDYDGDPIPGLYAAGETSGGMNGAVPRCIVTGRLAGQHLAGMK